MKLAVCLFKYFPYGGLQRDALRFLDEAVSRGHQVTVYCYDWEGSQPVNAEVRILPVSGFSNHARVACFIRTLRRALESDPVDVVFGFNQMPGLDFYFAADSCFEARARSARGWLYRLTSRYRYYASWENAIYGDASSTRIFLISDTEKAKFVRFYGTPEERMFMLPPGISRDRCAGEDAPARRKKMRQILGLHPQQNLLLFIGSGFVKKGLDRVIRALAALPETLKNQSRLLVVGKDKPARFRELAQKLGVADKVVFTGGRSDIPDLLLAGDLLLHPALDEAAGIVLLEAVVSGLPVIVTDVCGYAGHISQADSGIVLASPFQQSLLDKQLCEALNNPERLDQWKKNALLYAASEDLYSMHSRGLDLIEKFSSADTY